MTKPRGYAFFRAIGSPQRVVAPMVDQSELAFRMLTRRHGAELCYTPMLHSRMFAESAEYRARMFEQHMQDRPLIVQFCGNDPQTVLAAARYVENHCDAVDLNLGCPQGIARRGHYGSFLMQDKHVVRDIIATLSANLSVPVCAKIRVFRSVPETLEFCEMIQEAGCDMLVVHGRTKEMNKTTVGAVDWDVIRQIKKRLTIPVLANGGIESNDDVAKGIERTGVDGVMSSEAILENPALFDTSKTQWTPVELAQEYLDCAEAFPPANDKIIRAHLFKLLFQVLRIHTDVRTQLGSVRGIEAMRALVTELADRDAEHPIVYRAETSWYRRHRKGDEDTDVNDQESEQESEPAVIPSLFGANDDYM